MLIDLAYVAGVVNSYRKTRLMLLEILCRMARRLNQTEALSEWQQQSDNLIEGTLAFIPYHLASDPRQYLNSITAGTIPPMGRPVDGLLLLHPSTFWQLVQLSRSQQMAEEHALILVWMLLQSSLR